MLSRRLLEELLILAVKRVVNVSEKNSSVEIQEEESKIKEKDEDEFSLSTMFGVALIGAATSATLYYIYTQLSKETKASLKDIVIGSVKKSL